VPVVDARRGQVFYGLYRRIDVPAPDEQAGAPVGTDVRPDQPGYARSNDYGVCDAGAFGGLVSEWMGDGLADRVLVVAEENRLVGDLPSGVRLAAQAVRPETLVQGQELLMEPGESPLGCRLTPWLRAALSNGAETAPQWGPGRAARAAGSIGTPESVKPIYVRSPDADIHITKMKDPWAEVSARDGAGRRAGSS